MKKSGGTFLGRDAIEEAVLRIGDLFQPWQFHEKFFDQLDQLLQDSHSWKLAGQNEILMPKKVFDYLSKNRN